MLNRRYPEDLIDKAILSHFHQHGNVESEGILSELEKTGLKLELLSLQKRINEIKKSYPELLAEKTKKGMDNQKRNEEEGRSGAESGGEKTEA